MMSGTSYARDCTIKMTRVAVSISLKPPNLLPIRFTQSLGITINAIAIYGKFQV